MKVPNHCKANKLVINGRHEPVPGTTETWTTRDVKPGIKYDVSFCRNCGLAYIIESADQSKESEND